MGQIRAFTNPFRRRGDRGASGVEYALVVSLVLTGSSVSFEMMDDRVSEHYTDTAEDIGVSDLEQFNVTTTTCADDCEATTTTSTLAPTTTTTAAPATTTTTVPVTTTTAGGGGSQPTSPVTITNQSFEAWDGWTAKTRLQFKNSSGNNLADASFQVTWVTAGGSTRTRTFTTNSNGVRTPQWSGHDEDDFPIVMTIDWLKDVAGNPQTPNPSTYTITQP